MRLKSANPKNPASDDHLVPLINIVFLILIFFLVASAIRPFTDRRIELAASQETDGAGALQRAVMVHQDGTRLVAGEVVDAAALSARLAVWAREPDHAVTIVADGRTSATVVAELVAVTAAAGLRNIKLLTRRTR